MYIRSNPHPFISLLGPAKGKRLLPRLTRHLDNQRMLTLLTLLVACFDQLDVIANARLLDSLQDTTERGDADRQTQAFLSSVLQGILPIVAKANLRLVTGLLGLLIDRTDAVKIAQTRVSKATISQFAYTYPSCKSPVLPFLLSSSVELKSLSNP